MGTYKNKTYPLRIDDILMAKVTAIAENEDRKKSQQLERIVRQFIEKYEKENGEIKIDENGIAHLQEKTKLTVVEDSVNLKIG